MARKASDYYRANQGFATTLDGEPLFVKKGELVHKDHALLKGRDEMFEPAEHFGRFDVEQATAAPGEKRAAKPEEKRAPARAAAAKPEKKDAPAEKDDDEAGRVTLTAENVSISAAPGEKRK